MMSHMEELDLHVKGVPTDKRYNNNNNRIYSESIVYCIALMHLFVIILSREYKATTAIP